MKVLNHGHWFWKGGPYLIANLMTFRALLRYLDRIYGPGRERRGRGRGKLREVGKGRGRGRREAERRGKGEREKGKERRKVERREGERKGPSLPLGGYVRSPSKRGCTLRPGVRLLAEEPRRDR